MTRIDGREVVTMMKSCLISLASCLLLVAAIETTPTGAARSWIGNLSDDHRGVARLAFDDPGRLDWHFVPRKPPGLTFETMSDVERRATRTFLRSFVSQNGLLEIDGIMQLDEVLRESERAAGGTGAARNPLRYGVALFGEPAATKPWGVKLEGHHLSLNYTFDGDELISATPAFFGANPAEIDDGPFAGRRVLAREEDLGRELVLSLDEAQRRIAIIATKAPADILFGPGASLPAADEGLPLSQMSEAQRAIVSDLLDVYTDHLQKDRAAREIDRMTKSGFEKIRFVWAGGTSPGEGHYYRLQGETFVIEYDNTQNGANHVHALWRDPTRDFGLDPLREHRRTSHPDSRPR